MTIQFAIESRIIIRSSISDWRTPTTDDESLDGMFAYDGKLFAARMRNLFDEDLDSLLFKEFDDL